MSHWYQNGRAVDTVAIDDRALQYGDGLFETIAIRNSRPRLFERHLARLREGCACLRIDMPDEIELERELDSAVRQSHEQAAHCVAKIIVSSGVSQRGYGRLPPTPANLLIGVFPARPVARRLYRQGTATDICDTRLATHSATAGLKTLNRIEQVLGRSECLETNTFEGLMLDAEDRLICGTMSNVFIVKDRQIATPALDRCGVEGVMRAFAMDTLKGEGIDVDVRDIHIDELPDADEAFLTNSQFGALPIASCGETTWRAGAVTRDVMDALARNGIVECKT